MEEIAVAGVTSIANQITSLNWPLILSAVGIVEVLGNRFKKNQSTKLPKWYWAVPLLMGALVGVVDHSAKTSFATFVSPKLPESIVIYCGWVILAYYITIRPIRYLGDWLKRKSAGEK